MGFLHRDIKPVGALSVLSTEGYCLVLLMSKTECLMNVGFFVFVVIKYKKCLYFYNALRTKIFYPLFYFSFVFKVVSENLFSLAFFHTKKYCLPAK